MIPPIFFFIQRGAETERVHVTQEDNIHIYNEMLSCAIIKG